MLKDFQIALKKINSIKELKIGLVLLSILIFMAIFAPWIATYDPYALNEDLIAKPSSQYLFGTDGLGRDVFSMVVYGARTSIKVGVIAALISSVVGTLIGGISGYVGGKVDRLISEIMNMFLMLPTFFLILIIIAIYGSSLRNVILVIGLTSWTGTARLMRAQTISLKERTFIKSAKTIGESGRRILFRHIIPNGIFPIVADATMAISSAILSEAGLSFLGLGDPNVISWGQIISHGKNYLPRGWWICTFSGMAILFTVLSFYLIGEGINRILDPKLNKVY